jgi:hypothetical protein
MLLGLLIHLLLGGKPWYKQHQESQLRDSFLDDKNKKW